MCLYSSWFMGNMHGMLKIEKLHTIYLVGLTKNTGNINVERNTETGDTHSS